MKRNQFIKAMTATMLGYPLLKNMVSDDQSELLESGQSNSWAVIKKQFPRSKNWLDLNHAGLNRSPKVVLEAQKKYQKKMRIAPSMHRRELWKLMKIGRERLSKHINCSVDELALVSNTTEAMNTAINGIPLRKGSEVILGFYDYPHIRFQWEARAKRDQLKLKYVDIGSFPKSKNEIIAYYIKAVTKRTKVIQLTQIINYNGIHVPCEEIIAQLPEHVVYKNS